MTRTPHGFGTQADGSLVCPHRDRSVCDLCARTYPEITQVSGASFWLADLRARRLLADA